MDGGDTVKSCHSGCGADHAADPAPKPAALSPKRW